MRRRSTGLLLAVLAACTDLGGLSGGASPSGSPDAGTSMDGGDGSAVPPPPPPGCDATCTPAQIAVDNTARAIAADESGVYWTVPAAGEIHRANIDGSGVVTVYHGSSASPARLALGDSYVYFTDNGNGASVSAVKKTAILGGIAYQVTGLAGPLAIAISSAGVFWDDPKSYDVKIAAVDLSNVRQLGSTAPASTPAMAAIGTHAYVAVAGNTGQIYDFDVTNAASTMGSPLPTSKIVDLADVAVDTANLYWTSTTDGLVKTATVGGANETALATGQPGPLALAIDGTHAYFTCTTGNEVRRVPKAGGKVETLATNQTGAKAIAVNSRAIYWVNGDGRVMMLSKP